MDEQVILPPSIEDIPPPGLALVEELDKLLLVQVRRRRRRRLPPAACCLPPAASPALLRSIGTMSPPQSTQLRDGRKIIGTLRSFDQFANLVLSGAHPS